MVDCGWVVGGLGLIPRPLQYVQLFARQIYTVCNQGIAATRDGLAMALFSRKPAD